MVTIGIPVLNRYDLLERLIYSAESGTIAPDKYIIIDNGCLFNITKFLDFQEKFVVISFGYNIGVAKAWNTIIKNSDEVRIIVNDDVKFTKTTVEKFLRNHYENGVLYPESLERESLFSCFSISDYVVKDVGLFDETISPNYAYFEDSDYLYRMGLLRYTASSIKGCIIEHATSSTMRALENSEREQHHQKFKKARLRYVEKWGGLPGNEVFFTPFNK